MESKEFEELKKELNETKEQLEMEREQTISAVGEMTLEASLKNEAYGFIMSHGLLDDFIAYRTQEKKDPMEAALEFLLTDAEANGDWIAEL